MSEGLPTIYTPDEMFGRRGSSYDILGPQGQRRIKKLRARHKHVISLHLQGFKSTDIQRFLGDLGIKLNQVAISHILLDPLSQQIISKFHSQVDNDLRTLELLAVDAIRDALTGGSTTERLKASDQVFKVTGRSSDRAPGGDTAEDVIARAMQLAQSSVDAVREISRSKPNIIDITPDREATD